MARGDSTIRVNIIGDAKGLQSTLQTADGGIKGFSASAKKLGGILAVGLATDKLLDFGQTALAEADRLGDAKQRMQLHLGDLSQSLIDTADDFSRLGLSAQDVLELEAAFADVGTALGLADPLIAKFADEAAATAGAIALLGDQSPDEVIDLIGKAAGGSQKALRALGINLSDAEVEARALRDTGKSTADALTDGEKAAAAYALVLEKLKPKLDAATTGSGDLEQSQLTLQAKWETLTGKIGAGLEGPLNDLLTWMLNGIEGWEMLSAKTAEFEQALRDMLGPLARAMDQLRDFANLLTDTIGIERRSRWSGHQGEGHSQGGDWSGGSSQPPAGWSAGSMSAPAVTVNINGGDTGEVERAVRKATRAYNNRNGLLGP